MVVGVSVDEFGRLFESLVRNGGAKKVVRGMLENPLLKFRRVAVWVNGSASSIALAMLATAYFQRPEVGGRVLAVMTSGKEKQTSFRQLANVLRSRGVEVFDAQPKSTKFGDDRDSFEQLAFALREMVHQRTRTLLTWHTADDKMCYHIATLRRKTSVKDFRVYTEINAKDDVPVFNNRKSLRPETFEILRPLLTVSTARMEATCREYGVEPVAKEEDLCWKLAMGKRIYIHMSDEERQGLIESMRLVNTLIEERRRARDALLRSWVMDMTNYGMVVLHRRKIATTLQGSLWMRQLSLATLERILLSTGGDRGGFLRAASFEKNVDMLFVQTEQTGSKLGFTCSLAELSLVRGMKDYIKRKNQMIRVDNMAKKPQEAPSRTFLARTSSAVLLSREIGKLGNFTCMKSYRMKLGFDETLLWDNRYLVSVHRLPKQEVVWPTSQDAVSTSRGENYLPPGLPKKRMGYRDGLLALLDRICKEKADSEPKIRPFLVRSLTLTDWNELTARHSQLRRQTMHIPSQVLWTIPTFLRDGEILAVPTFNINYEKHIHFSAQFIFFPPLFPKDMDPSFPVHLWT